MQVLDTSSMAAAAAATIAATKDLMSYYQKLLASQTPDNIKLYPILLLHYN
jgi:hypothetical protein